MTQAMTTTDPMIRNIRAAGLLHRRTNSRICVNIWLPIAFVRQTFRNFTLARPARRPAPLSQRLVEIGEEVVEILDADRQADERVADAQRLALLGRQRGMRHDGGMLDQALDAAETLGQGEDLDALEEAPRRRQIAGELDRHHAAEALHLAARERVLRMGGKPGVVDAR